MNETIPTGSFPIVFLSPHIDDAVFSCGGTLARLCQTQSVLVVNVFGAEAAEEKTMLSMGAQRMEEEYAVSTELRYTPMFLQETNAYYRYGKQRREIFRPLNRADEETIQRIAERLDSIVAAVNAKILYVPLGIGFHADHAVCRQVARSLGSSVRLKYYEDAPYCMNPIVEAFGLVEAGVLPGSAITETNLRSWLRGLLFHRRTAMFKNIGPFCIRWAASPAISWFWWHRMAHSRKQGIGFEGNGKYQEEFSPEVCDVSGFAGKKLKASNKYHTQFPLYFGRLRDWNNLQKTYGMRLIGEERYCERFWSAVSRKSPNVNQDSEELISTAI